jgi:hypothetical protein
VQLLRAVNAHLQGIETAFDRGRWIRGYLAEGHLAHQEGERFMVDADLLDDCRRRSAEAVELIAALGLRVHGDAESLLVPDQLPDRRDLDSVTAEEMTEAAAELIADMLADVRRLVGEGGSATQDRPRRDGPVVRTLRRMVRKRHQES